MLFDITPLVSFHFQRKLRMLLLPRKSLWLGSLRLWSHLLRRWWLKVAVELHVSWSKIWAVLPLWYPAILYKASICVYTSMIDELYCNQLRVQIEMARECMGGAANLIIIDIATCLYAGMAGMYAVRVTSRRLCSWCSRLAFWNPWCH